MTSDLYNNQLMNYKVLRPIHSSLKKNRFSLVKLHQDLQLLQTPSLLEESAPIEPSSLFLVKYLQMSSLLLHHLPSLSPSSRRSLSCLVFFDLGVQQGMSLALQMELFWLEQRLCLEPRSLLQQRFELTKLLLGEYSSLGLQDQLELLLRLVQQGA